MNNPYQKGKCSLVSGGACALAFYILYGIIVLCILLVTVHNRPELNLAGLTDFSLPGFHNQLLPLLSAACLGYMAMRLARELSIRPANALILGMGTQAVYQTFPNNLWFYWKTYPTAWWIFLMAVFWTVEENRQSDPQKGNGFNVLRLPVLAGMFWMDWKATGFLILFYSLVPLRRQVASKWTAFMQSVRLPLGLGMAVFAGQYILIYSGISLYGVDSGGQFLQAYCEAGVRGLVEKPFPPHLPGWSILLILGLVSVVAVFAFVERKEKHFFHQAILISGAAAFLFSKIIFPEIFHEQGVYDAYLTFPLFLALFTLLPAWLETYNRHTGIFVLIAFSLAFCVVCVQLRNYAVLYPVVGPNFYKECLSGPFYHR